MADIGCVQEDRQLIELEEMAKTVDTLRTKGDILSKRIQELEQMIHQFNIQITQKPEKEE